MTIKKQKKREYGSIDIKGNIIPKIIFFRNRPYQFYKGPLTKSKAENEANELRMKKWPTQIKSFDKKWYLYVDTFPVATMEYWKAVRKKLES